MCSDTRQEFILLSDTLGMSMLVDVVNHRQTGGAESTVRGPFYVDNPPELGDGENVSPGRDGEKLLVEGSVSREDGAAVEGAAVDVWHSDGEGFYDVQHGGGASGRARLRTDAEGGFHFWTIQPAFYPIPGDGPVGADAGRDRPPPFPARARALHDLGARMRNAGHPRLRRGRPLPGE